MVKIQTEFVKFRLDGQIQTSVVFRSIPLQEFSFFINTKLIVKFFLLISLVESGESHNT